MTILRVIFAGNSFTSSLIESLSSGKMPTDMNRRRRARNSRARKGPKSASYHGTVSAVDRLRREKRARTVGDYLDASRGRVNVTREKSIASALSIMAAIDLDTSSIPEPRAELGKPRANALDVQACVILHNAIMARTWSDADVDSSHVKHDWFSIHGKEAETKQPLLGDHLSQFLGTVDVLDFTTTQPLSAIPLSISSPSTMFGDDNVVGRNTYNDGDFILLYKLTNSRGGTGGLVMGLDDHRCCWRSSLYDKPRDDWAWVPLQDALTQHLERMSQSGSSMALQYRPKAVEEVEV